MSVTSIFVVELGRKRCSGVARVCLTPTLASALDWYLTAFVVLLHLGLLNIKQNRTLITYLADKNYKVSEAIVTHRNRLQLNTKYRNNCIQTETTNIFY